MKSQTCVCEPVCRRAPPRPFSVLLAWRDARTAAASLAEMPADRELIREHTETRTLLRMTGHRDYINDTHDCLSAHPASPPPCCATFIPHVAHVAHAAHASHVSRAARRLGALAFPVASPPIFPSPLRRPRPPTHVAASPPRARRRATIPSRTRRSSNRRSPRTSSPKASTRREVGSTRSWCSRRRSSTSPPSRT